MKPTKSVKTTEALPMVSAMVSAPWFKRPIHIAGQDVVQKRIGLGLLRFDLVQQRAQQIGVAALDFLQQAQRLLTTQQSPLQAALLPLQGRNLVFDLLNGHHPSATETMD